MSELLLQPRFGHFDTIVSSFCCRPLTIVLMWAAKVTPLLGLSWEPLLLLLPPSEFLLMMPEGIGGGVSTLYKDWSEYCKTATAAEQVI